MRQVNVENITEALHTKGYAQVQSFLPDEDCKVLRDGFEQDELFRKTIVMERYRFGLGVYKYYKYPLPGLIDSIRNDMYRILAPVANEWMKRLNIDTRYPEDLKAFLAACKSKGQDLPTVLILKYEEGGFNTLHQDIYGDVFFPIQVVLNLNDPGKDYEGGEFVLTEQVPRAQSKAIVLKPRLGDLLIFTTNFRPVKGARGFYRASMKHGVSRVVSGTRMTLGIIFHDALS
jgi:uncharacterized protein